MRLATRFDERSICCLRGYQGLRLRFVAFGSNCQVALCKDHFRFAPNTGRCRLRLRLGRRGRGPWAVRRRAASRHSERASSGLFLVNTACKVFPCAVQQMRNARARAKIVVSLTITGREDAKKPPGRR
jgi:hypothetical protein